MRFIYLSRQFNRAGYYVLKHLLEQTPFRPQMVLLPKKAPFRFGEHPLLAPLEKGLYRLERAYYRSDNLRFSHSIRSLALRHAVPVSFAGTLKSGAGFDLIRAASPELLVLGGGWPELLPPSLIAMPPLGVINTHPSLLPSFRGADVHRWQILAGVKYSGATVHYVNPSFDLGEIIARVRVRVEPEDLPQLLFDRIARRSGALVEKVLKRIAAAQPRRARCFEQPPDPENKRYFPKWDWNDDSFFEINWQQEAAEIERLVRAAAQESYKFKGPFFRWQERNYYLRKSALQSFKSGPPGQVCLVDQHGIGVHCGCGPQILMLLQVQAASNARIKPRALAAPMWAKREGVVSGVLLQGAA